jgi:ANTAR domain
VKEAPAEQDVLPAELENAHAKIAQLESALSSRVVIEQAKGILHERFGWSIQEAFELLRYAARSSRVSIHQLAAQVVADGETPGPIVIALARRGRAAHMVEHAELQADRARRVGDEVRAQQERREWDERGRARARNERPTARR